MGDLRSFRICVQTKAHLKNFREVANVLFSVNVHISIMKSLVGILSFTVCWAVWTLK